MKNIKTIFLIAALTCSTAKPVSADVIQKATLSTISAAAVATGIYMMAKKKSSSGWETFSNNATGFLCMVAGGVGLFIFTEELKRSSR